VRMRDQRSAADADAGAVDPLPQTWRASVVKVIEQWESRGH